MVIHHLNCGTLHPPSRRLVNGDGALLERATLVCRCLLVPGEGGWTLVDTGLGLADVADPRARLSGRFLRLNRPALDPAESALHQVVSLGIDPESVTDIALTHLDTDHVGGIADFPWARVRLSEDMLGLVAPALRAEVAGRLRAVQWAHRPRWAPVRLNEAHHGRPAARIGDGVRLVALDGHLTGHCGVVVERPGQPDLIHAGDALFSTQVLERRPAPPGLALFDRRMRTDRAAWAASRAWLRRRHAAGDEIICAHEPWRSAAPGAAGSPGSRRERRPESAAR